MLLKKIRVVKRLGAVIALAGAAHLAAQSIGLPEASPKVVVAGDETTISVISSITDPNLIPNSVMLEVTEPTHPMPAEPMTTSGGGLYSVQIPLTIPLGGTATLRVSAMFNGTAGLVRSGSVTIIAVKAFISDFSPQGIEKFLGANGISTAAGFLQSLDPANFKQDWILMTASDSSQLGTATRPRVIIQSVDSQQVFGFQLGTNDVEYIQWDGNPTSPTKNRFRFHTVKTAIQRVVEDNGRCAECHSTGKKQNGLRWPYPRPNWDAYDSWGGAMPFNRDRIYEESVERLAIKALLKAPIKDPILAQLDLPAGMVRDGQGNLGIPLNIGAAIGSPDDSPSPMGLYPQPNKQITYDVKNGSPVYPGATMQDVAQGGNFFLMRSTDPGTNPVRDGGRAVAMFDHFSALNAQRIAQELVDSKPNTLVDVRPVALAIANGCVGDPTVLANLEKFAPQAAIAALLKFEGAADFQALQDDTTKRQQSLPQMKANQESPNASELLVEYAGGGSSNPAINNNVARRSTPDPGVNTLQADKLTGFMIDREDYTATPTIALFRLFLEPVGEPMNKWEMSILGQTLNHTGTYTFADKFINTYIGPIDPITGLPTGPITTALTAALMAEGEKTDCADLETLSSKAYQNVK